MFQQVFMVESDLMAKKKGVLKVLRVYCEVLRDIEGKVELKNLIEKQDLRKTRGPYRVSNWIMKV